MKKLIIITTKLVLLITICCFTACSKEPSKTIRIGILNGPSVVSFTQLIDQDMSIGDKKVEIIIKNEPLQIQALMMRHEIDFAILPTVMAANLYNKGVKYRMVACPIWGTLYALSSSPSIRSLHHLGKQTVSVFGQGSTSDILVQRILNQKGVEGARIDYSYSSNQELAQAILQYKITTAVISEPLVSNVLAQNPNIHIVEKIECEEYMDNSDKDIFVQTAFLVSDKFIDEHPELVKPVCDAYANSCNATTEDPERTAEILVEHKLSPNTDVAKRSIKLCNIQYVSAFAIQQELNRYLTIFLNYNKESIGGALPEKDFIYQFF